MSNVKRPRANVRSLLTLGFGLWALGWFGCAAPERTLKYKVPPVQYEQHEPKFKEPQAAHDAERLNAQISDELLRELIQTPLPDLK